MHNLNNVVSLTGNIGKNTSLRTLESGTAVGNTSIAVDMSYKNKNGEKVEDVQWFNLDFWGNNAKNAERLLLKGARVKINGELRTETYMKGDVKIYATKVKVIEFEVLKYVTEKEKAAAVA